MDFHVRHCAWIKRKLSGEKRTYVSTDNYQIAFVVLLGRLLSGHCCCLENVCITKPFLGSAARSPSKGHVQVRSPCLLVKSKQAFWKTALTLANCLLIAVVFLLYLVRCAPYWERGVASSGVFNKIVCTLVALRGKLKGIFFIDDTSNKDLFLAQYIGCLLVQIFITAKTHCRLIYGSCLLLIRGLGSVHQCKNMHWAGVRKSKRPTSG